MSISSYPIAKNCASGYGALPHVYGSSRNGLHMPGRLVNPRPRHPFQLAWIDPQRVAPFRPQCRPIAVHAGHLSLRVTRALINRFSACERHNARQGAQAERAPGGHCVNCRNRWLGHRKERRRSEQSAQPLIDTMYTIFNGCRARRYRIHSGN